MAQFRKKPVVIEAVELATAEPGERLWYETPPDWLIQAFSSGTIEAFTKHESDWTFLRIKTLEGDHEAQPGDWIIRGVKGELYPCKPDIFEATYESVEGPQDPTKVVLTVQMEVTPAQALALQAMFEYWTYLGNVGSSRRVAFCADGDGNFRPNCRVTVNQALPELTDELRQKAVVKDDHGDRVYDFDPIAWQLLAIDEIRRQSEEAKRDG